MTRQAQRQWSRVLRKAGDAVLRNGLPLEPQHEQLLGLAAVIQDVLAETDSTKRASDAAELVHRVNDTAQRRAPEKVAVACAKGCAYCCHTYVSAMAPEVFRIARALLADPAFEQRRSALVQRLQVTSGRSHENRRGRKLPCALLVDSLCSVYAARPSVCRKTAATAVDDCVAVFNGGTTGWTSPRINDVASSAALFSLSIALQAQNLVWHSYELSAALEVTLMRPDAEVAWLAGEDIFAGVRRDPRPAAFERNVTAAALELAAII